MFSGTKCLVFSVAMLSLVACSKKIDEPNDSFKPSQIKEEPGPTKLDIKDEVVGTGKEAKTGSTVSVHYTGTLMNGTQFDSSRTSGKPFEFTLGEGHVIKGWDQGVVGMKVGGKRKLTIPSDLAYGEQGSPPTIPPNAALKFDIELLDVK
jgi:FKBP-type peptidyl-prolyl cis-trans isomerase